MILKTKKGTDEGTANYNVCLKSLALPLRTRLYVAPRVVSPITNKVIYSVSKMPPATLNISVLNL